MSFQPGLTQALGLAGGLTFPQVRGARFFKGRNAARRQKKCKMHMFCRGPRLLAYFAACLRRKAKGGDALSQHRRLYKGAKPLARTG